MLWIKRIAALLVAIVGCLSDVPGVAAESKVLLVVVGGNSECHRDKGLWLLNQPGGKGEVTKRIAEKLRVPIGEVETHYFSWTGDPEDHPGCIAGKADYISQAHRYIREALAKPLQVPGRELVIVGWSNGGSTAYEMACQLSRASPERVSLLVTLDPVSRINRWNAATDPQNKCELPGTGGKRVRPAKTWIGVYTRSTGWASWRPSNIIALAGGAWNNTYPDLPANRARPLMLLQPADHGDVGRMWQCVLRSDAMRAWAERRAAVPATRETCKAN